MQPWNMDIAGSINPSPTFSLPCFFKLFLLTFRPCSAARDQIPKGKLPTEGLGESLTCHQTPMGDKSLGSYNPCLQTQCLFGLGFRQIFLRNISSDK
jgi:hypothetical protein